MSNQVDEQCYSKQYNEQHCIATSLRTPHVPTGNRYRNLPPHFAKGPRTSALRHTGWSAARAGASLQILDGGFSYLLLVGTWKREARGVGEGARCVRMRYAARPCALLAQLAKHLERS